MLLMAQTPSDVATWRAWPPHRQSGSDRPGEPTGPADRRLVAVAYRMPRRLLSAAAECQRVEAMRTNADAVITRYGSVSQALT